MYSSYHINSKLYGNKRCWTDVCHTEELWWVFDDDLNEIIGDTWNEQEYNINWGAMAPITTTAMNNILNNNNNNNNDKNKENLKNIYHHHQQQQQQ